VVGGVREEIRKRNSRRDFFCLLVWFITTRSGEWIGGESNRFWGRKKSRLMETVSSIGKDNTN
jgi:hypothetical protein